MRRAAALLFLLGACSSGATRQDSGTDAVLQVANAQFFRRPLPPDQGGPRVLSATAGGGAKPGVNDQACGGELDPSATGVAIALASDVGYWIVPARIPSAAAPESPTFSASYGFARALAPGPHHLVFRGVDGDGRFGPQAIHPFVAAAPLRPTGRLVISLGWDDQADLDLHVLLPTGIEIFKRNRTEYQRPPQSAGPVPPGAPTDGGVLDRDSNAGCVFDGQRAENVVWTEAPPPGRYMVRVDTFSLCGAASAHWTVEAVLDGVRIGAAQGTSTEEDLRFDHNRGAGLLALELDVP